MPAVTVDDVLTLPRLDQPRPGARPRKVVSVTTAPHGFEGDGFPVRRALSGIPFDLRDPFVLLDQMGEVDYAPGEPKGTPWHPHRGFETVTYMIDGTMQHADSHGGGGVITNGDTQWMTAGAGILHIEHPPEDLVMSGGLFHGLQLWVNLPRRRKWAQPRYQDIRGGEVALLTSYDGGALLRVIAGDLAGHRGPGSTYTPITLAHLSLAPGATVQIPWPKSYSAIAFALAGAGTVGEVRRPLHSGQTAVFGRGDFVTIAAAPIQDSRTTHLEVFLLGGEPIREPVVQYGPFVMNSQAEILRAVDDFNRGRMGLVPAVYGPGDGGA